MSRKRGQQKDEQCQTYYLLAWSQGNIAWKAGQKPSANPYPLGRLRTAWFLGWAPDGTSLKETLLRTWRTYLERGNVSLPGDLIVSATSPSKLSVETGPETRRHENLQKRRCLGRRRSSV
jgi:hypothetical protein